jgi:hypothetical protein
LSQHLRRAINLEIYIRFVVYCSLILPQHGGENGPTAILHTNIHNRLVACRFKSKLIPSCIPKNEVDVPENLKCNNIEIVVALQQKPLQLVRFNHGDACRLHGLETRGQVF